MKFLKKWSKSHVVGGLVRLLMKGIANQKAKNIAKHFSAYLQPKLANTQELKDAAFNIRHQVYCEELKFEPERNDQLESDDFDTHSLHCVIQHRSTHRYAGTVRIVCSHEKNQLLPIEKYCLDSIDNNELSPSNFPRHKICEISRLAVPEEFRRRKSDKIKGAATGAINESIYSEKELRCFPFIAVGLYLSAASIVMNRGIEHVFVMMEPRLARSLKLVGIDFKQIGPTVDYHGKRAPYYITPAMLLNGLTPGFKVLFEGVKRDLDNQFSGPVPNLVLGPELFNYSEIRSS